MLLLSAFAAGLLFGLGLIVSQMVNPAKVLAFLDVAGAWDPSLAFVITTLMGKKTAEAPARSKLELYERVVATVPGVERKGATIPYTSLNGHMFSYLGKT